MQIFSTYFFRKYGSIFLKILFVGVLSFGIHNKSEAAIGRAIGQIFSKTGATVAKVGAASTKLVAVAFAKTVVAVSVVAKKVYTTSCVLVSRVIVEPLMKLFVGLVRICTSICTTLYSGISCVIATVCNGKLFRAIVTHVGRALSNLFGYVQRCVANVAYYSSKLVRALFDRMIMPVLRLVLRCALTLIESACKAVNYIYDKIVLVLQCMFDWVIMPICRFASHCISSACKYVYNGLEKIGYCISSACKYAYNGLEKIADFLYNNVLVTLFDFVATYGSRIIRFVDTTVSALYEKILVPIFDFASNAIKKASQYAIARIKRVCFYILFRLFKILFFVSKTTNLVVKKAYFVLCCVLGIFPFMVHKMREIIVKDELEELCNPNSHMRLVDGAYAKKFGCHTLSPVEYAYYNKFYSTLRMFIEQKGSQVPDNVRLLLQGRDSCPNILPWSKFDKYLQRKQDKQKELQDKVDAIIQHVADQAYELAQLQTDLQKIKNIYADSETPAYTKQMCLVDLFGIYNSTRNANRDLMSKDDLKKLVANIPFTQTMYKDNRFENLLIFAKNEKCLDSYGRTVLEGGIVCNDNNNQLTRGIETNHSLYTSDNTRNNLFKSYLGTRPYPHGVRGLFSKLVFYIGCTCHWIKSRFVINRDYSAKRDCVGALQALRDTKDISNDVAYKRRFRHMANSLTVLADLRDTDLVKSKAKKDLGILRKNGKEDQVLAAVAERDDMVMGPEVAANILAYAGIDAFEDPRGPKMIYGTCVKK